MPETTPPWLKKRVILTEDFYEVRRRLAEAGVRTVCDESRCPNICECFSAGEATLFILGDVCTRNCGFCSVRKGRALPVDRDEPARVASLVERLGLGYAVITSVTRDDLPDGGAGQFIRTVAVIKALPRRIRVEILVPDFGGDRRLVENVVRSQPDVFGHNIETVRRLQGDIRPGAGYETSLSVLRAAKEASPAILTKSAILAGLGETEDELVDTMRDLRAAGCDILMIGQYLRPGRDKAPVKRIVTPGEFRRYEDTARALGFRQVKAGPFVRSSYRAGEVFTAANYGG